VIEAQSNIQLINNTFYYNGGSLIQGIIDINAAGAIDNCLFYRNNADVNFKGDILNITRSSFIQSGIEIGTLSSVYISNSTFTEGYTQIHSSNRASLTISNCVFSDLDSTAISVTLSNINVADTLFLRNRAGAMWVITSDIVCRNCSFKENGINPGGMGVVYLNPWSTAEFHSSSFQSSNGAPAIYAIGSLLVDSCAFLNDSVEVNSFIGSQSEEGDSASFNADASLSKSSYVFTSTSYSNGNYSFLLSNVTITVYNPLLLPFNASQPLSSQLESSPPLSWCSNGTVITNTLSLSTDSSCNVVFIPEPLVNGSNVLVRSIANGTTTFYYSWQNDNSTRAITITLSLNSDSPEVAESVSVYTVFASLISLPSPSPVSSSLAATSPPTLQTATWVSQITQRSDSAAIELNDTTSTLDMNGFYVIGVTIETKQQRTNFSYINEASLTIVSTPSSLDDALTTGFVVPKISFAGSSAAVHVSLLNNWGLETTTPIPLNLTYGNTTYPITSSGLYYCNTLANIQWRPWVSESIYLNGRVIGTGIGE